VLPERVIQEGTQLNVNFARLVLVLVTSKIKDVSDEIFAVAVVDVELYPSDAPLHPAPVLVLICTPT
jgi:hypothetical protein